MKKIIFGHRFRLPVRVFAVCLIIFAMLTIQTGSATIFFQDERVVPGDQLIQSMEIAGNVSETPFPVHFFFNTHCGSCQESLQYLKNFTVQHPDIAVDYHDLYNNTTSFALWEEYKERFNKSDIHYPVIFIGTVGIMGGDDIKAYTEPLAVWYQKTVKVDPLAGLLAWIRSYMV